MVFTGFTDAMVVFQTEYPKSIDFQIIIEIPDDEYETRGFKFIIYNLSELLENGIFADIKFVIAASVTSVKTELFI